MLLRCGFSVRLFELFGTSLATAAFVNGTILNTDRRRSCAEHA